MLLQNLVIFQLVCNYLICTKTVCKFSFNEYIWVNINRKVSLWKHYQRSVFLILHVLVQTFSHLHFHIFTFSDFHLNIDRYFVKITQIWNFSWFIFYHIQSKYEKIHTRKNSRFGRFSRSDGVQAELTL